MGWRFFKRIRVGGGLNLNLGKNGMGWSWGLPGQRYGVTAGGRRYVSVGIPGTGLYFQKYLDGGR